MENLKKYGRNFLITMLSHKDGFHLLTDNMGWTQDLLQQWRDNDNREYVERVENCLRDALNYVGVDEDKHTFRFPDLLNNPDNGYVTLGKIAIAINCILIINLN